MSFFSRCAFFFILCNISFLTTAQNVPTAVAGSTVLATSSSGSIVTVNDVLADLQRAPESSRRSILESIANLRQVASNLLVRRVLAKEAEIDGLVNDPFVSSALAIASDRVLSDARLAKIDSQNTPSRDALEAYAKDYYKTNLKKFERPVQTRVSHILLRNDGADSLQKAKDLLVKIRGGSSFEELAKEYSVDTESASLGGRLDFFSTGQMIKPFEVAVDKLVAPGDLSEPVESKFGFHIIRLDERREKGVESFEQVRDQLLVEAKVAILNNSRAKKVLEMNKGFIFEQASIEALTKSSSR